MVNDQELVPDTFTKAPLSTLSVTYRTPESVSEDVPVTATFAVVTQLLFNGAAILMVGTALSRVMLKA